MSELPDLIYAARQTDNRGVWAAARLNPDETAFVRADKVQALVEALRVFADQEAGEIDRHLALKDARAALAAFTDGGTQG